MDRNSFIKYVTDNQKALRRFLVALCCGDARLADDLAQDTLTKAYISLDKYKGTASFDTWVYRIAYNTFVSYRRACTLQVPLESARHLVSTDGADRQVKYQHLYLALEQLSVTERADITLFYLQGYDVNEIARITDSTVAAVKMRLSRGRKHLKEILSKRSF